MNNQTQIPFHITNETHEYKEDIGKDFSEVVGQPMAKRALEIAAAGKHNLLMLGPPGTGKTMLASRLPGILPALSEQEKIETISIASITNQTFDVSSRRPVFRNPHHTASSVALVGGGSNPKPGEISLAHNGILFLDELPEFDRKVLEVLREPLEAGEIVISRAQQQVTYPASFQLIAAMNPCPCGYLGDPKIQCQCTPDQVKRYRQKVSGPLLDRIDLQIEVARLPIKELVHKPEPSESSLAIKDRVQAARETQLQRQHKTNNELGNQELETYCHLKDDDKHYITSLIDRLNFSGRAYHRILKVSRTIADLASSEHIKREHVLEAINYRKLDRNFF